MRLKVDVIILILLRKVALSFEKFRSIFVLIS